MAPKRPAEPPTGDNSPDSDGRTQRAEMPAPTQPAASKQKAGPKKERNLSKFVVNNENSLMSEEYRPGHTPFDNHGPLPQYKLDEMLGRSRPRRQLLGPGKDASSSLPSSLPEIGRETQSLLVSALSSGDTVRQQLETEAAPVGLEQSGTIPETPAFPTSTPFGLRESTQAIGSDADRMTSRIAGRRQEPDNRRQEPPECRQEPDDHTDNPQTWSNYDLYAEPEPTAEDIRKAKAGKAPESATKCVEVGLLQSSSSTSDDSSSDDSRHVVRPGAAVRMKWQQYYEDGLTVLAAIARRKAVSLHWPVAIRMKESEWRTACIPLLCSMPAELVREILWGNVAYAAQSGCNKQIEQLFDPNSAWTRRSEEKAPCIYMRAFCDTKTGRSLTPNELRQVIHRLSLYAREDLTPEEVDLVVAVEQQSAHANTDAKSRHVKEGRRRYFDGKFADEDSSNRARQLTTFCHECQKWLDPLSSPLVSNTPLVFPLSYVGYTMEFSKRKSQHDGQGASNSSWLMNLFMAACRAVLGEGHEIWGFRSFVLCYCVNEDEVAAGEALLTILAGAWYRSGTGLAVHPPGNNVASAEFRTMPYPEGQLLWKSCLDFRIEHTPFEKNCNLEYERVLAYPEKRKQRIAAAKASAPDLKAETDAIYRRVEAEKNRLRRQMADDLAAIQGVYLRLQRLFPESEVYRAQYREKMEYFQSFLEDLDKDVVEPAPQQADVSSRRMSQDTVLPGTDEVLPSTEMDRS